MSTGDGITEHRLASIGKKTEQCRLRHVSVANSHFKRWAARSQYVTFHVPYDTFHTTESASKTYRICSDSRRGCERGVKRIVRWTKPMTDCHYAGRCGKRKNDELMWFTNVYLQLCVMFPFSRSKYVSPHLRSSVSCTR